MRTNPPLARRPRRPDATRRSGGQRPDDQRGGRVSIRPGVHHAGERDSPQARTGSGTGFNPPRRSSRRGTSPPGPIGVSDSGFQSAPAFITPGNSRRRPSSPPSPVSIRPGVHHAGERSNTRPSAGASVSIRPGVHHAGEQARAVLLDLFRRVSIRPGVHHAGEPVAYPDSGADSGVSIRPGVHHAGEPVHALLAVGTGVLVSIRPGVHHAGERDGGRRPDRRPEVSIRPGVHHAGERIPRRPPRRADGFNPPRRSSRRGTIAALTATAEHPEVSIRPGVHHAGEQALLGAVIDAREFQSAPAFITPGTRPAPGPGRREVVSIRPGVHHAGERPARTRTGSAAAGFNPPRRSSRRGTSRPTPSPGLSRSGFNPPRRSSRRGTTS